MSARRLLRRFQKSLIFCLKEVPKNITGNEEKKTGPGEPNLERPWRSAMQFNLKKNHVARAPRQATREAPEQKCHGGGHAIVTQPDVARTWRPPRRMKMPWRGAWCQPHGGGHPNSATRPATHLMRAWRTAMWPSLLPRGGPPLVGSSVALPATTITFQPHFSLLTIFSLSPSLFLSLSPPFVHV